MAEEIKNNAPAEEEAAGTVAKAPKAEKKAPKRPNFFVRMGRAIKKFFRDLISEMHKVVWLSAKETRKQTIVVVATVIVVSIVIGLVDLGFSQGIRGLSQLNLLF